MTTSKGTIQGYNGIAINDDKHHVIMQAQVWVSVGEQQTLKPAIEDLQKQLTHSAHWIPYLKQSLPPTVVSIVKLILSLWLQRGWMLTWQTLPLGAVIHYLNKVKLITQYKKNDD